jgi:enterochelin esterase-like enzyme
MLLGLVLVMLLQGHQLFSEFLRTLESTAAKERAPLALSYLKGRQTPLVEHDSLLHFVWYGHADSVFINGALQSSWRAPERMSIVVCGDSAHSPAFFYRSYTVPPDSRIEYKFIVDGVYHLDSTNRRVTPPSDFVNSEAAMPKFRMSPLSVFRPAIPHGTTDTLLFTSKDPLIKQRRVRIYLPPGYDRVKDLPAIYVHDGESAFRYAFFANIIDNLIADGRLPPIIGVFVPSVERNREYLGMTTPEFITAFCDELVPMIDRLYRTSRTPEHRGVMGISSGGHLALIMAIVRPDRFRCVAGQSSTIDPMLRTALAVRQQSTPLPPTMKVWIDCGSFDIIYDEYNFPVQNREFSEELTRYGIAHRYREVHDGHDWASWRERTPEILRFFFSR